MISQGAFGAGLLSTSNLRRISLGMRRPHYPRTSSESPANLWERNLEWLTIPVTGEEAEATHELSMSRLVAHADTVLEGSELKTGERFKMHMSDGYIGTSWWCWGGLESDLRDKPFHAWQKGADPDNWALGEDPSI